MRESVYGMVIGALAVTAVAAVGVAVSESGHSSHAHSSPAVKVAVHKPSTKTAIDGQSYHLNGVQPNSDTNVLSIIAKSSGGKLVVNKAFAGPYPDMTGVEVSSSTGKGGHMFLWVVTPPALKEPVIFSGNTYDMSGNNLTKQYLLKEGLISPNAAKVASATPMNPHDMSSILQHVWDDPASFVIGKNGPEVAVIMDPNCIFCHDLLKNTVFPLVKEGKIRAKIIPAGFLHPSSAGKAWHILAKGPSALYKDEKNFNVGTESGSITPYTVDQSKTVKIPNTGLTVGQGVMANNILLAAVGKGQLATPTLVFKKDGKLTSSAGNISKAQLETDLGIK